jgi:hypothetical protein
VACSILGKRSLSNLWGCRKGIGSFEPGALQGGIESHLMTARIRRRRITRMPEKRMLGIGGPMSLLQFQPNRGPDNTSELPTFFVRTAKTATSPSLLQTISTGVRRNVGFWDRSCLQRVGVVAIDRRNNRCWNLCRRHICNDIFFGDLHAIRITGVDWFVDSDGAGIWTEERKNRIER